MTKMATTRIQKRHLIYQRVLLLVDLLAPVRRGLSTTEICERINERMELSYSHRTIARDLQAMCELGYVSFEVRQIGEKQSLSRFWRLNLAKSENLQQIAFGQVEAG